MKKQLGFVIDRGLSPIDQQPYVAILTLESGNRKTGNMAQVWILREDVNPVEAVKTGQDYSICGDCPHRGDPSSMVDWFEERYKNRSCYVNVGRAPNTVWKTFKRGRYLEWNDDLLAKYLKGRKIRWGAYGDPSIMHLAVVEVLNGFASGHTGYTHQWRQPFASSFNGIFQASCDGFQDYLDATTHGWKTFVVVSKNAAPHYAKQCPATVEDSVSQCITCRLCDGAKLDVFVHAHGKGAAYVTAV